MWSSGLRPSGGKRIGLWLVRLPAGGKGRGYSRSSAWNTKSGSKPRLMAARATFWRKA